jgi:zinc transport system substrate-binding protein
VEPQYSPKVAETIAKEAKIPVALLDPVANGPARPPLDYYQQIMRTNLETLQRTLSHGTP